MTAADRVEPAPDLLADGVYRDPAIGRWSRMALAGLAVLALFCIGAVASSPVAIVAFLAIAGVALLLRARLARPRLIVRPAGLVVVGRFGQATMPWSDVAWAGGVAAPPPLAAVEQVLAVRDRAGRQLTVSSLRDAYDRKRGVAPRVAEMAASLLARAEWAAGG